MPGARLTGPMTGNRAEGEVNVKLGPIVSAFHGVLDVARDDTGFRGTVRGAGRDARSPSSARAIITYTVDSPTAATSRVDVSVKFLLTGALAQFSRSGLVKDVADHLTRVFAQNLEARLSGKPLVSESARYSRCRRRGAIGDLRPHRCFLPQALWRLAPMQICPRCSGLRHGHAGPRWKNPGALSYNSLNPVFAADSGDPP